MDLGAGTGSTARAMGAGGRWRFVDNDRELLRIAAARRPEAETVTADLRDVAALPLDGARLATASALLDLVSAAWLEALADRLAAAGIGIYAALNYDGAMRWTPEAPGDAAVTTAFNRHQRGDKGFGRALGPDAGPALIEAMRRRGYEVASAPSPWLLGPAEAALQEALLAGIAEAAEAEDWGRARRAALRNARCVVGHWDVLATPGAPSAQSKITSRSSP